MPYVRERGDGPAHTLHSNRHRDLKSSCPSNVCHHMHKEYPHRLSYNRFVERQTKVGLLLLLFLQTCALDNFVQVYPSSTPRRLSPVTLSGQAAIGQ